MLGWLLAKDSELFTEFADLIALDTGGPAETVDDISRLWDQLSERPRDRLSRVAAGSAGTTVAKSRLDNGFPSGCFLQHAHPHINPESQMKNFQQLRNESVGALRLALQCLSFPAFFGVKMLWMTGKPCWRWYTDRVKAIKSPEQYVRHLIDTAHAWRSEQQFRDLVGVLLAWDNFIEIKRYHDLAQRFVPGELHPKLLEDFVNQLYWHTLSLISKRSISMSKFDAGPERYVRLFDRDEQSRQDAWTNLLGDYKLLLLVEQKFPELAADLRTSISGPLRFVYQFSELGLRQQALRILRSLLHNIPDAKIIEDLHGKIKIGAKYGQKNSKQTCQSIQSLILNSGELEHRGIPHGPRV